MTDTKEKTYDLANLEREIHNLTKLVNINGIINSTLDIARLLTIIMEIIKDIMETEASTMLLYEEASNDLVFKVALGEAGQELVEKYRVKMGQGIAGWVAENRKAISVNDAYSDRRFDPVFDQKTGFKTKAILCTPLHYKGKLLGVIQAVNPKNRPEFNDDDLGLFSVFADQASLAVQNAIYFHNALEEERIKSELTSAAAIQDSLIPDIHEIFNNVEISAKSISAREIGGEFHNFFPLDSTSIGVALGDIHEKGIPGGFHASMVSGALRTLANIQGKKPWFLVKTLNKIVAHEIKQANKVSIFYGVIDTDESTIKFVNSGIAYPILVREKLSHYMRFGSKKLVGNDKSKLVTVRLKKGDIFVIVSDGILKIKNKSGKQLGLKQIMRYLQRDFTGPDDVIESLVKFAKEFSGETGSKEDISIIVFFNT